MERDGESSTQATGSELAGEWRYCRLDRMLKAVGWHILGGDAEAGARAIRTARGENVSPPTRRSRARRPRKGGCGSDSAQASLIAPLNPADVSKRPAPWSSFTILKKAASHGATKRKRAKIQDIFTRRAAQRK
jgi:hypothetical protein